MCTLVILTAIVLGAGCSPALRAMRSEDTSEVMQQLTGKWEKLTASMCSRVYPRVIEFRANGLYSGTGTEPGNAPGWDIGTWEIVGPRQVKISTMNDTILTYEFSLVDDILTFVDADKCEFQYRKMDY